MVSEIVVSQSINSIILGRSLKIEVTERREVTDGTSIRACYGVMKFINQVL